jgi:hypothetical protein
VIKKEGRAYIPLLWFAVIFGWLDIGPEHIILSPFSYLLMIRLLRYMMLVAVPIVVVIAMGIVRFVEANKKQKNFRIVLCAALMIFLLVTSIPANQLNRNIQIVQANDMVAIGKYLSTLPNNTRVFLVPGLQEVEIYSGAHNASRFYLYNKISNCTQIPQGSYLVFPKNAEGYNLTPNIIEYCPGWKLVLYPEVAHNYSIQVMGAASLFRAQLLVYNNKNATT